MVGQAVGPMLSCGPMYTLSLLSESLSCVYILPSLVCVAEVILCLTSSLAGIVATCQLAYSWRIAS